MDTARYVIDKKTSSLFLIISSHTIHLSPGVSPFFQPIKCDTSDEERTIIGTYCTVCADDYSHVTMTTAMAWTGCDL